MEDFTLMTRLKIDVKREDENKEEDDFKATNIEDDEQRVTTKFRATLLLFATHKVLSKKGSTKLIPHSPAGFDL